MPATTRSGQPTTAAKYAPGAVNHYEALDVPVGAAPAAVRHAYLAAARRHHPDFHVSADERTRAHHAQAMQMVNQAWAVLGNAEARERYDLTLGARIGPPLERDRSARRVETPEGKGWTPRADDDGWQDDYRAWADEDERMRPDRPEPRHRGTLAVIPVALFALAVATIFVGLVLGARVLLAVGFAAGIFSAILFVVMPVVEMSRGRHRR